MNGCDEHNPFGALNLPHAVQASTLKLLTRIQQAHRPNERWRAADRAKGFVPGIETVKALNPASLEGLYVVFDSATPGA